VGSRQWIGFEFAFECSSVYCSFQFFWKLIPDAWSGDGKSSLADFEFGPLNYEIIIVSKAIGGSARNRCCTSNDIFEVGGCLAVDSPMNEKAEFKFNSLSGTIDNSLYE
jgi:hypothetical protein